MKHLPKHLQPRWRYLAVTVRTWPDERLVEHSFQRALWESAGQLVGDAGSAQLDLQVVLFRSSTGTGQAVVRTRRETVPLARGVVTTLSDVDAAPVGVCVRGVAGTVRACEEKYLRDPRQSCTESIVVFNNAERTAIVRSGRADIRTDDGWIAATERDLD